MKRWRGRSGSRIRHTLQRSQQWRRTHSGYRAAEVGGYRVHWAEAGSGPPVVLLHGLCGSSRWWNANLPALAERFRVLAVDLLGFGRSRCPGPLPAIPELADLTARWLTRIGAAPAHVVGHSMGGHLAIHLAARHPAQVRRLVLADAAGLHRPRAPGALARWLYDLAPPTRWGEPAFFPVIWQDAWQAGPLTTLRALRSILRDDVAGLLPRIQAPTLVLWGAGDTLIPLEYGRAMQAAVPGARLHVVQGAYHNPMVDQPAEFNRVVAEFLAGAAAEE